MLKLIFCSCHFCSTHCQRKRNQSKYSRVILKVFELVSLFEYFYVDIILLCVQVFRGNNSTGVRN